jgi:hypothetical protein
LSASRYRALGPGHFVATQVVFSKPLATTDAPLRTAPMLRVWAFVVVFCVLFVFFFVVFVLSFVVVFWLVSLGLKYTAAPVPSIHPVVSLSVSVFYNCSR